MTSKNTDLMLKKNQKYLLAEIIENRDVPIFEGFESQNSGRFGQVWMGLVGKKDRIENFRTIS